MCQITARSFLPVRSDGVGDGQKKGDKMNAVAFIDEFIASYKPIPKDLIDSIVKSCQEKIEKLNGKK